MALPEQIRKQSEAVQDLYKQLNEDVENTGEAQETPPTDEVNEQVEDTVVETTADAEVISEDAAPSSEPEQKKDDEPVSEERLLQKYKTLQGMYNAEVPRLHSQNKEMQQKLQHMQFSVIKEKFALLVLGS